MKRARRHKFLHMSILFLLYSIIHVVSKQEEKTEKPKDNHHHIDNALNHLEELHIQNATKNANITAINSTAIVINKDTTANSNASKSTHHHIENAFEHVHKVVQENATKDLHNHIENALENVHKIVKENATKTTKTSLNSNEKSTKMVQNNANTKDSKDAHHHVEQAIKHIENKIKENATLTNVNTTAKLTNQTAKGLHYNNNSELKVIKSIADHNVSKLDQKNNTTRKCTPPAIQQFPRPLIGPSARKHGAIIIHILIALYTFIGLAIVCDEYFVASLDRICEELKMSPDVAGATFMAAGSSAPELATVILGVFLAEDDIGISGVIGSAVFNIMFVISVCALCAGTVAYLNWWPLVRDCFFYAVSILVMLGTIADEKIYWGEALFMLIMYTVYCVVLHFNPLLEKWAQTLPVPCKKVSPDEQSGLVSYKTLEDDGKHSSYGLSPDRPIDNSDQTFDNQFSGAALNQASGGAPPPPVPIQQGYYRPKEYNPSEMVDPLIKPTEGGIYKQARWAIVFPIHYLCRKTMPDCRSEKYKNWYPFTFLMSMIWISFYSYFMVWMITVIGTTCGIPDTVMGLTFVAAGVSVPDALSSIAVIKEGYGDMAVSNAVGSNVFDILVCLGLPWFIKTAIIKPGKPVKVISKGLTYSTLSLLSTVVFLLVATHMNGWKLDRKYGIILMVWYLVFITFASMYELNVFGYLNPPECPSNY